MSGEWGLARLAVDRGGKGHRVALEVDRVRRLEKDLMAALPEGTLMARAATALGVQCARVLREQTGGVAGRRVVLLVGAGDNGGDALYAGAGLAARGAAVTALLLADRHHGAGAAALLAAGGAVRQVDPAARADDEPSRPARELLQAADLVVDGILGIGGRGGLRGAAAALAPAAGGSTIAVDLPSGVDADTGAVPGVAIRASRTVVMGVLKPGLLVGEGRSYAGELTVVDIGLALDGEDERAMVLVDGAEARRWLGRPGPGDDKYTRGAVGISAGSARYPGAGVLAAGSARHSDAGFVRYAGPAAAAVVAHWPDVVVGEHRVADAGRVQCWVVGPGRGTDEEAAAAVREALASPAPVVLDADALTLLAERADLREAVRTREWPTVLTPHAGEFARLGGGDLADRVGAVRALAADLGAVVLLKGSTTLVSAGPDHPVHAVLSGPPELATAGSGDVLSGLVGGTLAHLAASAQDRSPRAVARAVAAAAYLHGVAGQVAARGGRSVAALDVLAAVPEALARVRGAADATG